jgi:hypothetical protein
MLGGALVVAGALALTLTRRPEAPIVVSRRTMIAVGPEAERWPALSPDGRTMRNAPPHGRRSPDNTGGPAEGCEEFVPVW